MAQPTADLPSRNDEPVDESKSGAFESSGCFSCCLQFPCFGSRKSDAWDRISAPENVHRSFSMKGVDALKKVREWSELVAGPKWKTFIRRFNKTAGRAKPSRFQYDPLNYALNFDEGRGPEVEDDGDVVFRDFSARYAAIPAGRSTNPQNTPQ